MLLQQGSVPQIAVPGSTPAHPTLEILAPWHGDMDDVFEIPEVNNETKPKARESGPESHLFDFYMFLYG